MREQIIRYLYLYLMTVPIFFLIDLVWIGLVARKFYFKRLGKLVKPTNWLTAIIFYLIYIVGIIVFAVFPAIERGNIWFATALGGFLGLIAYSTYDLSNYSTIKTWPLSVTLVDIFWGIILTGSVATASFYLSRFVTITL